MAGGRQARYDGVARWYDHHNRSNAATGSAVLRELLGDGRGPCLDLGSGTGTYLSAIAGTGYTPIGLELSRDQLSVARENMPAAPLVQGDGHRLPFADRSMAAVVAMWISTDVDDFPAVLAEAARVLRVGGDLVIVGAHPCFNGPGVEPAADGSLRVHPIYHQRVRHTSAPWWRPGGIRETVGGMVQIPLSDLLTSIIDSGLRITAVRETGTSTIPNTLAIRATLPRLT